MDESDPPDNGELDFSLEDHRQYEILRTAIEDALLNVLGTVVMLSFALGLLVLGAQIAVDGGTGMALPLGGTMILAACLIATVTLDIFP